MGLLAKNAILIVEFALDRRKQGMSISWAAVLGAAARLQMCIRDRDYDLCEGKRFSSHSIVLTN